MIPQARGALSEELFKAMQGRRPDLSSVLDVPAESDDDAEIALWTLYELSYRGFEDVDDDLEWDPVLLRLRRDLEQDLEARLRARFSDHEDPRAVRRRAIRLHRHHDGPALATYVQKHADARAGARAAPAPLALPPQGVRPDQRG